MSLYSTVAPLDIFPVRFVVIVASPSCAEAVQAAAPTSSKRIKVELYPHFGLLKDLFYVNMYDFQIYISYKKYLYFLINIIL